MLPENIFSQNFCPPNICDPNFCPPIFMTSPRRCIQCLSLLVINHKLVLSAGTNYYDCLIQVPVRYIYSRLSSSVFLSFFLSLSLELHSFIHFEYFCSAITSTQRRSRIDTVSKGLAQGPYVAAGVGFEPATLRTEGAEFTPEPPRPSHL